MGEGLKKNLTGKWRRVQQTQKWLRSFPDQNPTVSPSNRPADRTGVFFYQPSVLDYAKLSEEWFKERNKTFRENFVGYVTELFSKLIEHELQPDGTVSTHSEGIELYSVNLRQISRNYAEFNKRLIKAGLLDVHELHDADEGKCRFYGIPIEIVKKGVSRRFLTHEQRAELQSRHGPSDGPDKSDAKASTVVRNFLKTLARVKVDATALENLEIEAGRFTQLHPHAMRFMAGKYDAVIGKKDGRFHANYTYAPREFRSLLRYDGHQSFVEGDVAACHFHFLLGEITNSKERIQMEQDLISPDPYLSMCGNPKGVGRDALKQSSHVFKFGTRADVRLFVSDYESALMVPYREQVFFRHLSTRYPVFAEAMATKKITHPKHKSAYSCALMKRESAVMVHAVGERCMAEGLVYLPVHDGFMTLPSQYDRVCEIVVEEFKASTGSVPRIRKK